MANDDGTTTTLDYNHLYKLAAEHSTQHAQQCRRRGGDVGIGAAHECSQLPHRRVPFVTAPQQCCRILQRILHMQCASVSEHP